jgi:hypothetical protein
LIGKNKIVEGRDIKKKRDILKINYKDGKVCRKW